MTKRIFRSIFYVSLLLIVSFSLVLLAFLSEYTENAQKKAMYLEMTYLQKGVEMQGISYLEQLQKNQQRVTWIGADGIVLFDSVADVANMENHLQREEVQEALQTGRGESSRISKTLAEKTENVAVRLQDGSVLRVSETTWSAGSILLSMMQPFAILLALALVLAGVLASKTSKNITKPLENVDLEYPEQAEVYDELAPFLRRIAVQKKLIAKQIREQQQRQREFYTITTNMQEGLLVLDTKGDVLSCNDGAMEILGVTKETEKQNVYTWNRSEPFRNCIQQALLGKHSETILEQNERIYKVLANPVLEETLVVGVVVLLFDHTEKADAERLRREFTANVSHELKTPLTSISGFAEIIKNGMVQPQDIPHFANNIYTEAQKLIAMIQDIIQLSKLDEMGGCMDTEYVDLANVVKTVCKRLEESAKKQDVTLQLQIENAIIKGVPSILEEMIYNLCDNAIQYNKKGGSVTITIAPTETEIKLFVEDTGVGIPYEEQDRIFERFYRVSRSRSKEIDGTGLGLSIVKHGAILHKATVSIESACGKGSRFCIVFPKEMA